MFVKFSIFLAVLAPVCSLTFEEAKGKILEEVSLYQLGGSSLCESHTCCNISESESCNVASMPRDQTTLVIPGGESRCIFSDSTPYAFQVIPGDNDKVLFYFQGGGACWDKLSTKLGFCTSNSSPAGLSGIFNREEEYNRYKDHTIVHMLYCSGDVWGGDVVREYDDSMGEPVTQKGLANAQAALDWVLQQTEAGNFAPTLSELTVSGCSAGSIGAQLWGKPITEALKWKKAAVIPDSYAGIFPPGTEGPLIEDFGMCSAKWLNPDLVDTCLNGTLTLREFNLDAISKTSSVPYSFIQSKTDSTQESFYIAVGITMGAAEESITTPEKFYDDVNAQFGAYNQGLPNFVTYLVDGNQHCFTPFDLYYTADAVGAKDAGESVESPMMYSWFNSMPLESDQSVNTVCEGDLQAQMSPNVKAAVVEGVNKQTYCSSEVSPKIFTEQW